MTAAEDRVAVLLTLMRQLQDVMRTENGLLREMRLARLQELQTEKSAAGGGLRAGAAPAAAGPATVASLDRRAAAVCWRPTTREFQAAVRANADRLLQSRACVEGIVRIIGESLRPPAGPARLWRQPSRAGRRSRPRPG